METKPEATSPSTLLRGWSAFRRGAVKRWKQWVAWVRMAARLSPYLRRHKAQLGMALTLALTYTLFGLAEPWSMKLILDNVFLGQPLPSFLPPFLDGLADDRILLLNALVAFIVLLAFSRGLLYYHQQLLTSQVAQRVAAEIRLDLYSHLQQLSFSFHDRRRTGDVLTRLTSDVRQLRDIFISLPLSVANEVLFVCGMAAVMFLIDPTLTLLALLGLPMIAVILRVYRKPMKQAVRKQREREGQIANIASEVLGAIKVVQGFHREDYEIGRFTVENKRSLRTGLKASRLEAKFRWFAELSVALVTALVVSVAARRVLSGALSPGDLIVFVAYVRSFTRPLRRVSSMAERAARGTAAGERIQDIMAIKPAVRDRPGAVALPRLQGEIELDDVSFWHRRRQVILTGVNLHVRPGERVAIVGPTGAGKTTLISLIPRFYDPTAGIVRIDGRDVRDITLRSLRDGISLVFQEPVLFATTIAENIGYGKPGASMDEIVEAATKAGIHSIIDQLPDGYGTILGERGGTLSGGQRQCVAIARAMIRNSPIVLLDEPTAGLDGRSAALVLAAIDRLMEGRTVIMITHLVGSVRGLDRIVVLEGGRIADEGTHDALFARAGLYRTLQELQAGVAGL